MPTPLIYRGLLYVLDNYGIFDAPGQVKPAELIERIGTLNPTGATRIAATQVGPADAGHTLKTLAEKYGGAYAEVGDGASAQRNP